MTTKEFFNNLLNDVGLKIDDDERKLIEEKQNLLREKLHEKLPLQDDFLTGSYKRHTIIRPKDEDEKFDVDVFVAFDKQDYGETELSELRELVINALHKIKDENPNLDITDIDDNQRRSVGVVFENNFQIDIVPAIQIEKDKLYKIFDKRTLKSVKSNPKLHGELLSKANDKSEQQLVTLIKLIKAWKRNKCDYIKSFHIELMAIRIFQDITINSFADGVLKFFENGLTYANKACLKDPANNEYLIDAYLDDDGKRQEFVSILTQEVQIAKKASDFEKSEKHSNAIYEWKKVFNGDEDAGEKHSVSAGPTIITSPPKPWCNVG